MSKFIDDIDYTHIALLEHVQRGLDRQIRRIKSAKVANLRSKNASVTYPATQDGYNEFLELTNNAQDMQETLRGLERAEINTPQRYSRRKRKPICERTSRSA